MPVAIKPDLSEIERTAARLADVSNRLRAAQEAAAKADTAATIAKRQLADVARKAAAGETVDPDAAHAAIAEATRRATFAAEVVEALQKQRDNAAADHKLSYARAHEPVFRAAVDLRISAARAMDEARAALQAAEADHATATSMINAARQQGCGASLDSSWSNTWGAPITEASERAIWREHAR